MTTRKRDHPAVVCAENIVLLSMLNETPSPPQANALVVAQSKKKKTVQRILSFKEESDLVRRLSFLAAVTDDPNHVVAICLEELPTGDGMRVMLAINKKSPDSSHKALDRIRCGLEKILQLLSRTNASSGKTESLSQLDAEVYKATIQMCKDRILARLGYQVRHQAPARKKSSLAGILTQAASAVQIHYGKMRQADVAPFLQQTTNLVTLLRSWNGSSSDDPAILHHLQPIILAISHFTKTINLANILSPIPTTLLNPELKQSLPLRLSKLTKYRTISLYLLRSAQTLPLFLNTKVLPISLPPSHFSRDQTGPSKASSLANRLSLCQISTPAAALCQKLNVSPDTANTQFLTTLTSSLKESKIHAEVQLVAHYELHPTPLRPRVIASSKDACYLCNLFVATHGGFCVPRTHGKLYKGWRLPVGVAGLEAVQERMNGALEARIRKAVGERMAAGRWTVACPNESTGWTDGGSMETLKGFGGVNEVLMEASGKLGASPREQELHHTPEEEEPHKPAGQPQRLPEPVMDKDDPGQLPPGEARPMSDISTKEINSGAGRLSTTASELTIKPSPLVEDKAGSKEDWTRKSPDKTPSPAPRLTGQSPSPLLSHGVLETNPQSPKSSLNENLQAGPSRPGDPSPLQAPFTPPLHPVPTTPPSPKGDISPIKIDISPTPTEDDTEMSSPTPVPLLYPPPRYISPLVPSPTADETTPTATHGPEESSTPTPSPSPQPKPRTRTKLISLSQTRTTIHRLHPPPTPTTTQYVYTTGTIDVYPTYNPPPSYTTTHSPHDPHDPDPDIAPKSSDSEPDPNSEPNHNGTPVFPPPGVVEMRIRWLPRAVAAGVLRRRHGTSITRVEGLPSGAEVEGGSPDRGYLVRGEDVVLVEVVRG